MNWQTLETAPRNGTEVLLALSDEVVIGYYTGIGWRSYNDPLYSEPTHWMPLPEPPKGDSNDTK